MEGKSPAMKNNKRNSTRLAAPSPKKQRTLIALEKALAQVTEAASNAQSHPSTEERNGAQQALAGKRKKKLCRGRSNGESKEQSKAYPDAHLASTTAGNQKILPSGHAIPTAIAQPPPGSVGNTNWAALKLHVEGKATVPRFRKRRMERPLMLDMEEELGLSNRKVTRPGPRGSDVTPTKVVALDCEMVGVGPNGRRSSLARVCVVNDQGNVLLDKFVRQKERVTDYRTRVSGIRRQDVMNAAAVDFEEVQREVADLISNRTLVGHAILNDLQALLLTHPKSHIRDTACFPPLMRINGVASCKARSRALKHLALDFLGLGIQEGEHSPIDDARAALYLYQHFAEVWERCIRSGTLNKLKAPRILSADQKLKGLEELAANDDMVDL